MRFHIVNSDINFHYQSDVSSQQFPIITTLVSSEYIFCLAKNNWNRLSLSFTLSFPPSKWKRFHPTSISISKRRKAAQTTTYPPHPHPSFKIAFLSPLFFQVERENKSKRERTRDDLDPWQKKRLIHFSFLSALLCHNPQGRNPSKAHQHVYLLKQCVDRCLLFYLCPFGSVSRGTSASPSRLPRKHLLPSPPIHLITPVNPPKYHFRTSGFQRSPFLVPNWTTPKEAEQDVKGQSQAARVKFRKQLWVRGHTMA